MKDLTERADDLENRGRRKNICIIGLPEDVEGNDPVRCSETWLPKLLNVETKAGRFKVEQVHHMAAQVPSCDQRPRPALVRLHNYCDKQRIMSSALEKEQE